MVKLEIDVHEPLELDPEASIQQLLMWQHKRARFYAEVFAAMIDDKNHISHQGRGDQTEEHFDSLRLRMAIAYARAAGFQRRAQEYVSA